MEGHAVFLGKAEVGYERDDADHRHPRLRLYHGESGLEDFNVPPELVDHEPLDTAAVTAEELYRAVERREYATLVDVADEDNGGAGVPRHGHVHDVRMHQVDLRGTSGPFHHDHIVPAGEEGEGFLHHLPGLRLERVILTGGHRGMDLALEDDLGAGLARCLEENGVHMDRRLHPGGLGLEGLCPAYLASLDGDIRVECHVLRLEGRDAQTHIPEYPAKGGGDQAFARPRPCSLDHKGFSHTAARSRA
jgi:hypothetical protein